MVYIMMGAEGRTLTHIYNIFTHTHAHANAHAMHMHTRAHITHAVPSKETKENKHIS